MSIVKQKNKKSGVTYVYESTSYWDKDKKQPRAKRKLIGKLDDATGDIITTKKQNRSNDKETTSVKKRGPVKITDTKRCFYGASYLLDEIGKETGLVDDLKICFPNDYKRILSIAYYLIMEENNALSRFSHWHKLHKHPHGKDIASQRSSELFASIDEVSRMKFFKLQGKRRIENEYWAFDTTSISSYSETLRCVKKGNNKEHDRLEQINLALLFGEKSGLPFYYRKLPGNITDVKIVKQLVKELDILGYEKVKVLLDRGFYSKENIDGLFKGHQKFLIGTKLSLKFVKDELDSSKEELSLWRTYNPQFAIHGITKRIEWDYEEKRPYKGDVIKDKRRAYLHLFYDPIKESSDRQAFNEKMTKLYNEILTNDRKDYNHKSYTKYFEVIETPKRGKKVLPKEDAMKEKAKTFGYFAMLSNDVKDAFEALSLYRSKDIVEKGFGNLKDRLKFRRLEVSSELSLNGKIFTEFIALIYLSFIKKKMQDAKLFEKYTLQGLLDEIDLVEVFETPDGGRIIGEVTNNQKLIFENLGFKAP